MAKPIRFRSGGVAIVKMGFDNSVDARNFLAQIAHLVRYDGPDSKEIVFQIDSKSIRQAAEWGLKKKEVERRLRKLSIARPRQKMDWFYRFYHESWSVETEQQQGLYSSWMTHIGGRTVWSRNRLVQYLWLRRAFDLPIDRKSLQYSAQRALTRLGSRWAEIAKYAGFDPKDESSNPYPRIGWWSAAKVVELILYRKQNELGLDQNSIENDGHTPGLQQAMIRYFRSWREAISAAGINPDEEWRGRYERFTPEETLAEILKRKVRGESLLAEVVLREHTVLHYSAVEHYGSWSNALEVSGVGSHHRKWSPKIVVDQIKQRRLEGKRLNYGSVNLEDPSLMKAAIRYFKTWYRALTEAGLDPLKETTRPDLIKRRS